MTYPYGLMSDLHCHDWSAFASLDSEGRNTRLMATLHEIDRCCEEVKKAGGNHVVIAGDVFHVRGSVKPSVFNPVKQCLNKWMCRDMSFTGIAGNHDLETRDSNALGSSVAMLQTAKHPGGGQTWFHHKSVCDDLHKIVFVPWSNNLMEILDELTGYEMSLSGRVGEYDAVIHHGIDGTLSSLKEQGLGQHNLKALGFKRVFAGDYHHHKDFGNGVYSIGATTQQTWGDVGTKAGFMLVYEDRVQWFASHAPSFVQLTGEEDPDEVPLLVDGHFVSAKIGAAKASDVAAWREKLTEFGAKGVVIQSIPDTAVTKRAGVSTKSISKLDDAVSEFVTERGMAPEVNIICADILREVRS